MNTYTASEKTRNYVIDTDPSDIERAAIMFYILEGWETGWPYPDRPIWLKDKYPDYEHHSNNPSI